MNGLDQLMTLANEYAKAEGVELSTVSSRALNDGKKLPAIARGADIQSRRLEQTIRWFSANWPDQAPWPNDVPRPEIAEAS